MEQTRESTISIYNIKREALKASQEHGLAMLHSFQEAREEDRNEEKDLVPSLMIQENICKIYNDAVKKDSLLSFQHYSTLPSFLDLKVPPSLS